MSNKKKFKKITSCCSKEVTYKRGTKPDVCPYCGDKYWDKPKDERDLFILQNKYFSNGKKEEDLGKMYQKILDYSSNIILGFIKNRVIYSQDKLNDKAESIATILLEKYLTDPNFKIENSFGGLMKQIAKGVLFNKKVRNEDRVQSLDFKGSDDESMSITENPNYFITDPTLKEDENKDLFNDFNKITAKYLINEIEDIIRMIYKRLNENEEPREKVLFLIGLKNFFKNTKKNNLSEFYSYFGNTIRSNIEKTKLIVRNYLIENMRE